MVELRIRRLENQNDLYSFSIYSGLIYVCTGICSKIVETFFEDTGEIVYSVQMKNYLGIYESLISLTGRTIITLGEGVSKKIIEQETHKIKAPTAEKVTE